MLTGNTEHLSKAAIQKLDFKSCQRHHFSHIMLPILLQSWGICPWFLPVYANIYVYSLVSFSFDV